MKNMEKVKRKKYKIITSLFLIGIVISSISFYIHQENKENQRQSEIKKNTANKHISYIKQFEKENPDIIPMIKRNAECLSKKIKPQSDCNSYVYKDTTPSQQLRYRSYLEESKKIRMEFSRKINKS